MAIVITGSIGAGKTTLLKAIELHRPQYTVRSVDEAVRGSYNDPSINWQMRHVFLTKDRRTVSDLVFSSPSNMEAINHVMMPYLQKAIEPWFMEEDTIIEMPLYFESYKYLPFLKWCRPYTYVVTVACDDALRLERVLHRDSMTKKKFDQINALQVNQLEKSKLSNATIWVDNNSTHEIVLRQFDDIMTSEDAHGYRNCSRIV